MSEVGTVSFAGGIADVVTGSNYFNDDGGNPNSIQYWMTSDADHSVIGRFNTGSSGYQTGEYPVSLKHQKIRVRLLTAGIQLNLHSLVLSTTEAPGTNYDCNFAMCYDSSSGRAHFFLNGVYEGFKTGSPSFSAGTTGGIGPDSTGTKTNHHEFLGFSNRMLTPKEVKWFNGSHKDYADLS
jgi:hypothetical protein